MRYLSLFSGIESATVAWQPLGWEAAAFAETDKFPMAVLRHHYPDIHNFGDVTRFERWPDLGTVDLVCGGSPCQSFSIAGLRKGLDDPRGDLMFTYVAINRRYRPRYLIWENVPGVLSLDRGRAFAGLLGLLSGRRIEVPPDGWRTAGFVDGHDSAYGCAWRTLDAQYCRVDGFGRAVPQRRRRVFVVGCAGNWRNSVAVLFERASLSGNLAPRRQTQQEIAADAGSGAEQRDRIAARMTAFGEYVDDGTASTLKERDYKDATDLVAHALSTDGFVESKPLIFDAKRTIYSVDQDVSPTLRSMNFTRSHINGGGQLAVALQDNTHWAVRRLTPRECERLQGFPDDYTLIPWRGKQASDAVRYKALGNAMAVNVMRWIGTRIEMVENLKKEAA